MNTVREQSMVRPLLLTTILLAAVAGLGQAHSPASAERDASAASTVKGTPADGRAIFYGAGQCLSCHRVGAQGSTLGPNLSNVGSQRSPDALRQSLLQPPDKVEAQNRLYEIVMDSGKTVRGKLLNQGPSSVQMLDSSGQLVAYPRTAIRGGRFVDPPPMPSFQGKLTSAQIEDLVAYLSSLRVPAN